VDVRWAFHTLVDVVGINKERLYVTYSGGDGGQGADLEAKALWDSVLPPCRVLPFGSKNNFWEMGGTGPRGPCAPRSTTTTSAAATRRAGPRQRRRPHRRRDRLYRVERRARREPPRAPSPPVDTAMGFERLVSIVQHKTPNYDTDVFTPHFAAIHPTSETPCPYSGIFGTDFADGVDIAPRVVADHIRTLMFAVADCATPSVEYRGFMLRRVLRRVLRWVLRRVLRRAVRRAVRSFNSSSAP